MSTIVIDPGHGGAGKVGGSDGNHATGPNGILEKNVTLAVSVKLAELLNQDGRTVSLTRNNDSNLSLSARAKVASDNNADVFLSIHFNGDNNTAIQGTEVWVHPAASDDSKLLAFSVLQRMVMATGYKNRGVRSNDFGVLDPAIQSPATACCLSEISFLSNADDADRLTDENYILSLAKGLQAAITDFINRASIPVSNIVPGTNPANGEDA